MSVDQQLRQPGRQKRNGSRSARTFAGSATFPIMEQSRQALSPPLQRTLVSTDLCLALDCEMVGVGPAGAESTLARVTVVNYSNEVVLDTFVKQRKPVTDYRTFISGVRREDVESEDALSLEDCRSVVKSLIRGKILIGHGLTNDLSALGISHPVFDVRDTATFGPFMRTRNVGGKPVPCPKKLRDLAWEELGVQIQVAGKAHCPQEDALAAMQLYRKARMQWESHIMRQVGVAIDMEMRRQACNRIWASQSIAKAQELRRDLTSGIKSNSARRAMEMEQWRNQMRSRMMAASCSHPPQGGYAMGFHGIGQHLSTPGNLMYVHQQNSG